MFKGRKMNNNCILLTGTIDPSVFNNTTVALTDVNTRLKQYEDSIKWWIEKTNFNKIVFVENSSYPFDFKFFERRANCIGKHFEYINGTPYYDETIKYGKSYGEVRLINDAVERSKLLSKETSFFKCTGRLKIKNVNRILKQHYANKNVFLAIRKDKWVISYFFSVEKSFYKRVLSDSYLYVDDLNGQFLENVYYSKLIEHKNSINIFKCYPNVEGVTATSNTHYHSGIIRLGIKTFLLKIHWFDI